MKNSGIKDPVFLEAVEAIDAGDIIALKNLLSKHPELVDVRLDYPDGGYFKNPYLLWFVADNPIRIQQLSPDIVEITRLLIAAVKDRPAKDAQQQLDYALGLVATGRIPKECGVQIKMMDMLIEAGATPGGGIGALAHGNPEAAEHLIERGANLTLTTAVGLGLMRDVEGLALQADSAEKLLALTVAAFYGNADMISYLLDLGFDPDGYPANVDGFHQHATPLHQAVSSGSLQAVRLLAEAGAKLDATDKIYNGTPLDWAQYLQNDENTGQAAKIKFAAIAGYLAEKEKGNRDH